MADTDSLNALTGGPRKTITLNGQSHTIEPLRVAELPAFIAAVQPLIDTGLVAQQDVQAALMKHPDDTLDAIAIAARLERAALDRLGLDDLLVLAAACIEVNADFFTRTLVPLIDQISDEITTALAGSTSPPDSSTTATGTTM